MEFDGDLLPDQAAPARGGPQFGLAPLRRRALVQPTPDDLLVGGGGFPRPAWNWSGDESVFASVAEGGDPAPDGRGIDPQEIGALLGRVPLANALHRETTPVLQLVRCALCRLITGATSDQTARRPSSRHARLARFPLDEGKPCPTMKVPTPRLRSSALSVVPKSWTWVAAAGGVISATSFTKVPTSRPRSYVPSVVSKPRTWVAATGGAIGAASITGWHLIRRA